MFVLQFAVSAAVLEVDQNNALFRATRYQNQVSTNDIHPIENGFKEGRLTGAEQVRFSTSVNMSTSSDNYPGNIVENGGAATVEVVYPFKSNVNLESITLTFNNALRRYFIKAYVSADGTTWTEVGFSAGASKEDIEFSYAPTGGNMGPAVSGVWATTPAGSVAGQTVATSATNDTLPLTLKLDKTYDNIKYFKFAAFGNDNAVGVNAATNEFFSFNALKFEGTVSTGGTTPATTTQTPAATTATVATTARPTGTAPSTSDNRIIIFAIIGVVGAAGVVVVKKVLR